MHRLVVALAAGALFATASVAHALTETTGSVADSARVIVKLRPDTARAASTPVASSALAAPAVSPSSSPSPSALAARARAIGQRLGVNLVPGAAIGADMLVVTGSGIDAPALAARLTAQGDVEYAVPDRRRRIVAAPSDPLYSSGVGGSGPASGQWYLRPNAGEVTSSIDAETAWAVTTGSSAIVVAVLDTGVRYDHPDNRSIAFGGNLLPGYDMISDVAIANDGDGRDGDPSDPGDWLSAAEVTQRGSEFYQCATGAVASSWHGSQTSGLIAATTDNGLGMASVARDVRVVPVRVIGKCGGFDSDILAGMRWAAGLPVPGATSNPYPARVLNMSLGGEGSCDAPYVDVMRELTAAGVLVVASAGNAAGHALGAPADCPGVVAVGGLRHVGTKVGFSNLGPDVALSAPGGNCVNVAAGAPCLFPILSTTNAGRTVPAAASYTDSYDYAVGTSFSAPLVAGTAALVLSARPELQPEEVTRILKATARPFPATGGSDPAVVACTAPQYDTRGQPVDQLECYCTTSTCGAGMLDAGAALQAAAAGAPTSGYNVQGLWWNAPAGSESGWGINFAHQGDVIFATWFTYDAAGKPWWLSMTATRTAASTYAGTIVQTRGRAFTAVPFDSRLVTRTTVGDGVLTFSGPDAGSFRYTVNGKSQSKAITREVYGTMPTCSFALHPPLASVDNYQDLWWAAPAGIESGWGVNITQQSDIVFATWFTYDATGAPTWLSATATKSASGVYAGALNRTSGPAFDAVPFDPAKVTVTPVGSATFTFTDGNTGTFAYTVDGVSQSKPITRQVFRTPGTACR